MKTLKLIAVSFAAALVLGACTEEKPSKEEEAAVAGDVLASSYFEDLSYDGFSSWTKAYFDRSLTTAWADGDLVSVFQAASVNEKFLFHGEDGEISGEFIKKDDQAVKPDLKKVYAIYPYDEKNACSGEGKFSVDFPSSQVCSSSYMVKDNLHVIAATEDMEGHSITFMHMGGYLGLQIWNGFAGKVNSIEISGNNGEVISGMAEVELDEFGTPELKMADGGSKSVTLTFEKATVLSADSEAPTVFYVALPPVTFQKGITVKVTTDAGEFTKSSDKSVQVSRACIKTMNVSGLEFEFCGTVIAEDMDAYGQITEKGTGAAIAGVPVTDGYSYVRTDANGVYQMKKHPDCRIIYYSLPAEYKRNMDENNCPVFYSPRIYADTFTHADFVLERNTKDESGFTLFAIADPQVTDDASIERFKKETVADILNTINDSRSNGECEVVLGVTLGDIVDASQKYFAGMKTAMSNLQLAKGDYLNIYQCIGNHDHQGDNEIKSTQTFVNKFGPTDYSFNIGKAHILVFDDYYYEKVPHSGPEWAGVTDAQMEWIRQDLATVEDKENTLLIVCVHAPFGDAPEVNDYVQKKHHYADLLGEFAKFHDAHILSGHTHYSMNYLHDDYICKSGRPIYSHNQASACGYLWGHCADVSMDGAPMCYYIYRIDGNEVVDWKLKPNNGRSADWQMNVFDGNQVWTCPDNSSFKCSWWNSSVFNNYDASLFACDFLKNSLIVNLWDGDFSHWTVSLEKDGESRELTAVSGNEPYTNDMPTLALYENPWGAGLLKYSRHYWYITLPDTDISSMTGWKVVARQTVPSSKNITHTYERNVLQTDFSGYGYH